MRLISRSDTLLAAALIASAVIVFRQPLDDVIRVVEEVEARFRLDLLPALLLLVVTFSFHQYRKWLDARTVARAAAADAVHARAQAHTLQQLMALGQALASAHDRPTLEHVLRTELAAVAPDARFWLVLRNSRGWDVALQDARDTRSAAELGVVAEQALGAARPGTATPTDSVTVSSDTCFPLLAGDAIVGVLGVMVGGVPLAHERERTIHAAAAVLAIGTRNVQLFLETRDLSLRDSLTGCFNRAHALQTLSAELRRVRRTGSPLSILMFDIDRFKMVNDRYGHLSGDELLSAVGARLALTTRTSDIRCRYGGDEFLVILPETPIRGAQQVAEGIRKEVAGIRIGDGIRVSVSIGVATATVGELDPKAFIDRADHALYEAKVAGRDRVSIAATAAAAPTQESEGETFELPLASGLPVPLVSGLNPAALVSDLRTELRPALRLAVPSLDRVAPS